MNKTLLCLCLACFTVTCSATTLTLRFEEPARNWETHQLPLGNGTIGAVVMADPLSDRIQFTVDSLWTGDENPTGGYERVEKGSGEGSFGAFQTTCSLGTFPPRAARSMA